MSYTEALHRGKDSSYAAQANRRLETPRAQNGKGLLQRCLPHAPWRVRGVRSEHSKVLLDDFRIFVEVHRAELQRVRGNRDFVTSSLTSRFVLRRSGILSAAPVFIRLGSHRQHQRSALHNVTVIDPGLVEWFVIESGGLNVDVLR
jgi:hypothetical protein